MEAAHRLNTRNAAKVKWVGKDVLPFNGNGSEGV